MRLLFVASDRMEFPGLLSHMAEVRDGGLPLAWSRTGKFRAHDTLLAANGAGWARAAAAVEAARQFHPDVVINTGFCGALDSSLQPADVVVGTGIFAGGHHYPVKQVFGPAAHRGVICSIDHVAAGREEKRALRETGACAVEMEAAGVASGAAKWGVPLICVRAVTDTADEEMANDFNAALRADGHFDTMIILRGALRRPVSRLPELVRLRSRSVRAGRSLGVFFASCRFESE
jgi:adenosylhomocysteine nucleosidase